MPVLRHAAIVAVAVTATMTACTSPEEPEKVQRPPYAVAFIGDSYTAPVDGGPSYWQTTAAQMCWDAKPFGVGGSGYTIAGMDGRGPYVTRLDEVVAAKPDVVVVQGSFNDHEPDIANAAATILFRSLHQRLPAARVFVMGPVTPPLPGVGPQITAISDAVRSAAEANWTIFVDARNFLDDPSLFAPDGIHPNERGHQVLGAELAEAMPPELSSCD